MFSIGDVESIEVLKDGAAAAIYGSDALPMVWCSHEAWVNRQTFL